jgi:hypothetical protein
MLAIAKVTTCRLMAIRSTSLGICVLVNCKQRSFDVHRGNRLDRSVDQLDAFDDQPVWVGLSFLHSRVAALIYSPDTNPCRSTEHKLISRECVVPNPIPIPIPWL